MSDVAYSVLTCLFSNVINHRWQIILSKFVETKIKVIFSIFNFGEVFPAVNVATIVSKPNIKSSIQKFKR